MPSAAKVGALVLVFAAMMLGAFAMLRASLFAPARDAYYAEFADAGGLAEGAPVLLAGVVVGEVTAVKLSDRATAVVTMSLDKGRTIPQGTVAVLPSSFIAIGDRQVLLQPPTGVSAPIPPHDPSQTLVGQLQSPLEGLFPDTETTIAELNKTLVAVQKLLGDEELKGGVTNLMESGAQTAQSFGRLAGTMDRELSRSAPKINRILDTVAVSLSEMQVVATRIREVADDPKLKEEATKLLASLGEAANQGQLLVQDLRRTTNDPELQASLKATLKNFETMSDSGTRIAADAERMATNGVAISEEVKTLMGKANKLADEVEKLVGDAKKGIERFTGPGGSASLLPEIGVETDLIYQVEPNLFRIDANVLLPAGKEKIVFGLYDAFESNKINLQLDRQIDQRLGLRYGVYASKPGLGVSYAFAPNVRLRGDLYGLNDTQFDLRLRYDFSGGVHIWGGVEGIFGRNAPAIGIGIKR